MKKLKDQDLNKLNKFVGVVLKKPELKTFLDSNLKFLDKRIESFDSNMPKKINDFGNEKTVVKNISSIIEKEVNATEIASETGAVIISKGYIISKLYNKDGSGYYTGLKYLLEELTIEGKKRDEV